MRGGLPFEHNLSRFWYITKDLWTYWARYQSALMKRCKSIYLYEMEQMIECRIIGRKKKNKLKNE